MHIKRRFLYAQNKKSSISFSYNLNNNYSCIITKTSPHYKDGSSEELSIVKCPAILYKNQYLSVDLYALELIQEEVDN